MQLGLGTGISRLSVSATPPPESVGVAYVGTDNVTGINATSHTFSAVNIGTASAYRKLLIMVAYEDVERGGAISLDGMTVNGTAATELVDRVVHGDFGSAQYIIDMPSGTSADIVLTFNSVNAWAARIDVYNLEMDTVTAHDTKNYTSGGGDIAANINAPANGAVMMHVTRKASGDISAKNSIFYTETTHTEDFEGTVGSLVNRKIAGGHALITTADSSYVCNTGAGTGFSDVAYTVVSFAPA
jgi:hypothetical protein